MPQFLYQRWYDIIMPDTAATVNAKAISQYLFGRTVL